MSEPKVALFYGDPYQCGQALTAREAALGVDGPIERITRFGDELDIKAFSIELSSGSLFASRRHFLLRHAEAVNPLRALYPIIEHPFPAGTYLTLISATAKGIETLRKRVQKLGKVQGFSSPRGQSLHRAVKSILDQYGVRVPPETVAVLAARTGGDLMMVDTEAKKLATYTRSHELTPEALSTLTYSGGEESVYPFIDRIGERNQRGALSALTELHVNPSRTFSVLLYHVTRLLTAHMLSDAGLALNEIATLIGTPEWLARRIVPQAQNYTHQELAAALALGIKLDQKSKHGDVRPEDALLQLTLAITSRRSSP